MNDLFDKVIWVGRGSAFKKVTTAARLEFDFDKGGKVGRKRSVSRISVGLFDCC